MKRKFSAWVVLGAVVLVLDVSWGLDAPVSLSSAALIGPSTGAALLVDEPFINPFGTKKPRIVSGFGKRKKPIPGEFSQSGESSIESDQEMHDGIDYAAPSGTVVRAARSGKVLFAGFAKMYASRTDKKEQHRLVIIRHVDGRSSRYVHLSGLRIRPGQEVAQGQALGVLAESDEWTESVLHFEIRDIQGKPVNPAAVIVDVKKI